MNYIKRNIVLIMSGICLSAAALAQELPPNISVSVIDSGFIYETAPFPSCHASTLVETDSGMLAAWFGGTNERNPDVCIYTSLLKNGKWETPKLTADGVVGKGRKFPCWNPVLFKTDDGDVVLYYKVGPSPSQWWGMYKTSSDRGVTWSAGAPIPKGFLGPIKNKPIRLADGRILNPTSFEREVRWRAYMEITNQDLTEWTKVLIDNNHFNAIQPAILAHPDGVVQILCRSREDHVVQSWSTDGGSTWSPLETTDIPNPNAGIDAVTMDEGLYLLVCNPVTDGRYRLAVMASADGRVWKEIYLLEDHNDGEFSYPAIIKGADGLVHITYTWQRKKIRYVSLRINTR
jgi:alpha-L-fucosidase